MFVLTSSDGYIFGPFVTFRKQECVNVAFELHLTSPLLLDIVKAWAVNKVASFDFDDFVILTSFYAHFCPF